MENKYCNGCKYCKPRKKLGFLGLSQITIFECYFEPPKIVLNWINNPITCRPQVHPEDDFCNFYKEKENEQF